MEIWDAPVVRLASDSFVVEAYGQRLQQEPAGGCFGQGKFEGDGFAEGAPEHLGHVAEHLVEIEIARLQDLLAAEGEQLAGECGGAARGLRNLLERFLLG